MSTRIQTGVSRRSLKFFLFYMATLVLTTLTAVLLVLWRPLAGA